MDLLALRSNVRTRMGVPGNDALITDSVLTQLVNGALHAVEGEFDWPWLEKIATGTLAVSSATQATPADWTRTISVQVGDYPELEKADISRLRRMSPAVGRPEFFAVFGSDLHLRPIPGTALTFSHLYIGQEPDLVANADTPLLPATYHHALIEFAAYLGFRRTGNAVEAGAAFAAWEAYRDRMIRRHSRYSMSEGGAEVPADAQPAEAPRRR